MQMQRTVSLWFGVEVIEALRIEGGRASNYAMYLIAFREKQFGKIRPVLTRDADNKGFLHFYPSNQLVDSDSTQLNETLSLKKLTLVNRGYDRRVFD